MHTWYRRLAITAAVLASLLAVFVYSRFLIDNMATYAAGSDASGYFNSAKLLAREHWDVSVRPIPDIQPPHWNWLYQQPLGFEVNRNTGRMVPTYPVGLPLQLLGASRIVGWKHAATLVNVVSVLAIALLLILVSRRLGLSLFWAVMGVVWLLACPLFVFISLQPMTDMPATAWTLATLFFALKAKDHRAWSLAAGAAIGMAVLIRPTNLLLIIPVLYIVGLDWRRWCGLVMGGLPFAIFLAIYNLNLYGHVFTTGYDNVGSLLKLSYVPHISAHFAKWIVLLMTPLALLALAVPWSRRTQPKTLPLLVLWFLTFVGFYVFYYHSGETWWYLRFILPAFPAIIIAALLVAQTLFSRVKTVSLRTFVAVLLLAAVVSAEKNWNHKLGAAGVQHNDHLYYIVSGWLRNNVPPDSVMVAMQMSGSLEFYTKFPLVRYDLIPPEAMARFVASARTHGFPIYAPLFSFELPRVIDARMGGEWEKVATFDYVTIWRLKL